MREYNKKYMSNQTSLWSETVMNNLKYDLYKYKIFCKNILAYMKQKVKQEANFLYKIIDNNIPQKDYDVLLVSDKNSDVIANIINRLNN